MNCGECGIRCRECMHAHDYHVLEARWKALCREAGFSMRRIARAGGRSVWGITTAPEGAPMGGYVSAGIHGDEPAGPAALLRWCGIHRRRLARRFWTFLPCLNPWGLCENSRHDEKGRDLNRSFHLKGVPMVRGWKGFVGHRRFLSPAVMLHEDYEGDGIYVYAVGSAREVARRGIAAAGRIIAPSRSPRVDRKWRQEGGIVRLPRNRIPPPGVEALHVLEHHADATTTMETPSETALELRVRAQVAFLNAVLAPLL